jgi:hypothetical protein
MKQLFLIFLILLSAQGVDAQKIRFTDSGNVWMEISSSSDGASYRHYSIGSDTTIGTYQYKNITVSPPSWTYNNIAVREDTTGKVFFLIDSSEILMYDYSLQMGDTFRMINQQDTFLHFLSGIDSVTIGIDTYKVFNLFFISTSKPNGSGMNYKAIEGIGCVEGFLLPYQPAYGLAVTKLLCFTAKGTSPEVIPSVQHFDNKTSCKVSVENVISDKQNITISPHPANASSVIALPYILQNGELTIYNTIGQTVRQFSFNNTSKLPLGQMPGAGMYYYRVNDKLNGKGWQGKVVYE